MKRRDLLKSIMGSPLLALSPQLYAAGENYNGRLLLCIAAEGAWDVASFCDPKTNQAGKPEINRWARSGDIQTAGNIAYAPFANNAAFFDKYYTRMLVINGIDAQTNSHTTGVLHNWSGRNSVGYPSLPALFAATHAPTLPLAHINNGGYSETAGIGRYTRLDNVDALRELLEPNVLPWNADERRHTPALLERIALARQQRLDRILADPGTLPREKMAAQAFQQSLLTQSELVKLKDFLPDSDALEPVVEVNSQEESNLRQQVQLAILAFRSGTACSANLAQLGFDTHTNHDDLHEPLLGFFTDTIDYLWEYAEAQGVADRLTVVVSSDFSRTPFYNDDNGKDHWPIGSCIVMEKSAPWTNRVVGLTDEAQNAYRINPSTLARDDTNGTRIYPKHVHRALRQHLGIDSSSYDAQFPLNTENFAFFS